MKTKQAILDYQLSDVLEMHFSKNKEAISLFKAALLDRPIKDFNLCALFSFLLEDALVVIGSSDMNHLKRLYLLDSNSESFRTCCIHSIPRQGGSFDGRKIDRPFKSERLAPA